MTPEDIEPLFTRHDGTFLFARWGRPIAPIVFGVDDATMRVIKGAIEAVSALSQHPLAETDPELGSNLMFFFFREWSELLEVPDLDRLVPDMENLVARLTEQDAGQYRFFRFDETGAIKAAFSFLRMSGKLADVPAESIALNEAAQMILLWSDEAFKERSPLAQIKEGGALVLRPDIAAVISAAYHKVLPSVAKDSSFALRLAARTAQGG